MKSLAKCYDTLRDYVETVPLVDCHDHSGECGPKYTDPLQALIDHYFRSDLVSASSDEEVDLMEDLRRPLEERWPVFERAWKRTRFTGYAEVPRRVLKHFYGEDELTLEALKRMQPRLLDLADEGVFDGILAEAGIKVRIGDIWPDLRKVIDGTLKLTPRLRLAISLPGFHAITSAEQVNAYGALIGRTITTLDDYLEVCRTVFEAYKQCGAVAFKDQSAYERSLNYGNPTRAQAEEVFNWIMADPRRKASYPDGIKPLDDYLFHAFMRMARDMELPVQIHTGHMAGIRNDITKTNAVWLTPMIELHRDVRFDLFHANWPYSGELLFLAKNYPNVTIDFCWTNIVDPLYCQALFQQALSSVPHGKIHGYGSDFSGYADHAWAHAQIARENIAISLADLVEKGFFGLDDAREVAYAWLFGNPNQFFRLGLPG